MVIAINKFLKKMALFCGLPIYASFSALTVSCGKKHHEDKFGNDDIYREINIEGIDGNITISLKSNEVKGNKIAFKKGQKTTGLSYGDKITIILNGDDEIIFDLVVNNSMLRSIKSALNEKYNFFIEDILNDSDKHVIKSFFSEIVDYLDTPAYIDTSYEFENEDGITSFQSPLNPLQQYKYHIGDLLREKSRNQMFQEINEDLFNKLSQTWPEDIQLSIALKIDTATMDTIVSIYKVSEVSDEIKKVVDMIDEVAVLGKDFKKGVSYYQYFDSSPDWLRWWNRGDNEGTVDDPKGETLGKRYNTITHKYRLNGVLDTEQKWNDKFGPFVYEEGADNRAIGAFVGNNNWNNIDHTIDSEGNAHINYNPDGTLPNKDDIIRMNVVSDSIDFRNGKFYLKFDITKGGEAKNDTWSVQNPKEKYSYFKEMDVIANGNQGIDESKREEYREKVQLLFKTFNHFRTLFSLDISGFVKEFLPQAKKLLEKYESIMEFYDPEFLNTPEKQDKYINLLIDSEGVDATTFLESIVSVEDFAYFDSNETYGLSPRESLTIIRVGSLAYAWYDELKKDLGS